MTCGRNPIGEDELQLIDFSEEDDYLIAVPFRDSLEDLRLSVNLNECDRIKLFESINSKVLERIDQAQSESMDTRRQSFLRKSLAWDSAFFTGAGVLNVEELYMINKGFNKGESNHSSLKTQKHIPPPHRITPQNQTSASKKTNICPKNNVKPVQAPKSQGSKLVPSKQMNKATDSGQMKYKTRKAGLGGPDLSVSKRSRWGDLSGLPKPSTSFTSPINQKDMKLDCSYESSSSASSSSSKSTTRRINPINTKAVSSPSSVHSPCSSIEGWFSESLSCNTHYNSPESETRSSMESLLLSSGPKRKTKSSGLRMPSPKIGFFDEVAFGKQSPLPNRNTLNKNKFQLANRSPVTPDNSLKVGKFSNGEHDRRKVGASFSKLKPDGQTPNEKLKNRMNMEQKRLKDDGSFQAQVVIELKQNKDESDQKENMCSFEDQVNGLSICFEVIDLNRDVGLKGQVSVHSSRTPLAEKTSCKQ